jgi:hypothetical protein
VVFLRRASHVASTIALTCGVFLASCAALQPPNSNSDGNKGDKPQSNAVNQSASPNGNTTGSATADNTNQQQRQPEIFGWPMGSFSEFLTVLVTAAAVFAAWVTLQKLKSQTETMEGQLAEMRAQAGDMKTSLHQATRSAVAMERIAEAMAVSVQSVKDSLVISRDIADTNKGLLSNQRAFLAVSSLRFAPQGPLNVPTYTLEVFNSGQLPATITKWATVMYTEKPLPDPCDHSDLKWRPISGVVAPGKLALVNGEQGVADFTQDTWTKLKSGELALSFHIVIRYDTGITGVEGETSTGAVYEPNKTSLDIHSRFAYTTITGYNYAR